MNHKGVEPAKLPAAPRQTFSHNQKTPQNLRGCSAEIHRGSKRQLESRNMTPSGRCSSVLRSLFYLRACLLVVPALMGHVHAAEAIQQSVARVWRLSGTVTATLADPAQPRTLNMGDAVFFG
jgi:hypothetical protein